MPLQQGLVDFGVAFIVEAVTAFCSLRVLPHRYERLWVVRGGDSEGQCFMSSRPWISRSVLKSPRNEASSEKGLGKCSVTVAALQRAIFFKMSAGFFVQTNGLRLLLLVRM
jgi:hypothetical protein